MIIHIRHMIIVSVLLMTGCASSVPREISKHPEPEISYAEYLLHSDSLDQSQVRWGGDIIEIENKDTYSLVEILSHELGYNGRPQQNDNYQGRFIARVDGFLDPEFYAKGRQLTVFGKLDATMQKSIDDHNYTYPVVDVQLYHLWPEYINVERMRVPPYGYYPYYYSRYPYPFYGHPYWFGYY